jgi:DNA repair protein RecO (recombination protein O)
MLLTTKAIVLHTIKYNENSVIVHTYTEQNGRMAYVVNGAKSKKSVLRSALLQPLSLLELETVYQQKKDLQRIKESRLAYAFTTIPYDPAKNALSLFIAELLFRSLKEPQVDKSVFEFLFESVCLLDKTDGSVGNFHLVFMLQLSAFLGFKPNVDNYSEGSFFDLQNGVFVNVPGFSTYLTQEESANFCTLCKLDYRTMSEVQYSKEQKSGLLKALIAYYKTHLSNFSQIKSVEVLVQLFA